MPNISSVIKAIQDIMRKDTGVDGDAQRLSQIVWMLFLKIFADKEAEAEIMKDDYKSPLEAKYRWQNWAQDDEGMTGDELIDFINNDLFPYLQNLENDSNQQALIIRNIFQDTYNYMKSGTLLRQVINKIPNRKKRGGKSSMKVSKPGTPVPGPETFIFGHYSQKPY